VYPYALLYQLLLFFLITWLKVRFISKEPFPSVFVKGVDESIASLLSSNRTQSVDEAQAIVIAGLDLVEELKKGIEHGKPVIIDPTVEQMALLNGLMVSSTTILLYLSIRGFLIEYRFSLKRVVDIIIGLLGSAITVILLPFIALAIFIDSPGPIFYTPEALGSRRKAL